MELFWVLLLMRRSFILTGVVTAFVLMGCQRGEGFEVPAEVGRGLSEVDSLRALLQWLEGQRSYEADSLRLWTLLKLIKAVGRQNPDSAYRLAQRLEALAQRSSYPAAQELRALGWASAYLDKGLYDSALFVSRQVLYLPQAKGHEKLRSQALYMLGLCHQSKENYDSALTHYFEVIALGQSTDDNRVLAASYDNIASIYYHQGRYEDALEYYQKALQILEATGDRSGLAAAYNDIGLTYAAQGQYMKALDYLQRSIQIKQSIHDMPGLVLSYNNIGIISSNQGQYAKALEYFQKALQIQETLGNKIGLAGIYNNIGNIYEAQERYLEALEYYQKALPIWQALGYGSGLATSYNNLANIYLAQGRYTEALEFYQKALQIWETLGNRPRLVDAYYNIGDTYKKQRQHAKALEYYQKAITFGESIGDKLGLTFYYASAGDVYFLKGQPILARPYLLKALAFAREIKAYDRLQEVYLLLAQTDSALAASGQPAYWKTAYEYARLHSIYKDSVVNKESIRRQAELESQYQYEKKVALLKAQQEQERLLAQAELRRQKIERNLSLSIAGLTLAAAGVLGYFLRIIRRQKKELEMANQRLEQANVELEQVNAELKTTNKALEESNRLIQAQAKVLVQKNEEILDSIRYAERIQRVILPSEEKWRRLLPESFRVYLPRDIVAGDFYWLEETERYVFLGIADATGHGVPGAFVSLVCASALNKAVLEEGLESPAQILGRVKVLVSELLTREGESLPDGMDIALVRFEKAHPWRMVYAGANRPLWIVSQAKELIELAPTRQPVGYTEEEKLFEEVAVDVASRRPVMVYGFTDGIVDQMGGPKGRKLMAKGLKEFLLGIANLPCEVQRERIEAFFAEWKGERRQMDDVTVVGVRVG